MSAELLTEIAKLKTSEKSLRSLTSEQKNKTLSYLVELLKKNRTEILNANTTDLKNLSPDTTTAFVDRLTLTPERIQGMILGIQQVIGFKDPVNEVVSEKILSNGLNLKRVRAPLGTILMIFEARPNVITEVFSLAFKSGNTLALRGGSESRHTSSLIYSLIYEALNISDLSCNPFFGFHDYDRSLVSTLLGRSDLIDVVIPRGGEKLIQFVQQNAKMPIIKNDRGMCHTYVDASADIEMAVRIVTNAKTQRPGVCNSLETLLVHTSVAAQLIPKLYNATEKFKLQWNVDEASAKILIGKANVKLANPICWDIESLDLIMNCKVVSSIEEAILHIEKHGSKHSEAIITTNEAPSRQFQNEIDAAAVYWNASTRFTDGFEFGLGGEIGISTQKLHVRGPVGMLELTTPRWLVDGSGQIRES